MHYSNKTFFLFSCAFLLISNGCKKSEPQKQTTEISQEITVITASDIEALEYTEYVLSDLSKEAIRDWMKFQDLQVQINQLKSGNITFFENDKDILKELLNELKTSLPEQLNDPSIFSRIVALETSAYKLHDEAVFNKNDKTSLLNSLKEVLKAYSSLIFQLNKKFEKQIHNIQKPS